MLMQDYDTNTHPEITGTAPGMMDDDMRGAYDKLIITKTMQLYGEIVLTRMIS